jgi:hypothetical protein
VPVVGEGSACRRNENSFTSKQKIQQTEQVMLVRAVPETLRMVQLAERAKFRNIGRRYKFVRYPVSIPGRAWFQRTDQGAPSTRGKAAKSSERALSLRAPIKLNA